MTTLLALSYIFAKTVAAVASIGAETLDSNLGITTISFSMGGSESVQRMNIPPIAPGMMHEILVGGTAGLVYTPNTIKAAPGDMVKFNFMAVNHTLTQSTFAQPCAKMANGADSGFMPNPNNTVSPAPSFMLQVMDINPTWFYCKQKTHCGKGMVFSINPTANKTNAAFMAMAMAQNSTTVLPAGVNNSGMSSAIAAAVGPSATTIVSASSAGAPPLAATQTAPTVGNGTASKTGETCSCSCLCGVAAFPAGAGLGSFGGMSGSLPNSASV